MNNKFWLVFSAVVITLAALVHADPVDDEIQAQKKRVQEDIRKDREREALRQLLEALTKSNRYE